ncbi:MAG: hypothetical protein M3384_15510 [Acidobacteriota bacterium]|nr:hypothetical protein [Acidobacteriota bacterium]
MNRDLMRRKYGKPERFSYPYQFHRGQPEKLAEILRKADSELTLSDFGFIFSMHEPDADYEEGLYYIPLCFENMKTACPLERNVCVSLFWYIEYFKDKLEKDGFYEDCLKEIENLFEMFTGDFTVINEYQPSRRYRLSKLEYGLAVDTLVYGATQSEETWSLITPFLFNLRNRGAAGSCWWIMISAFVRDWLSYDDKNNFGYKKRKIIFEHFHKFGEYAKHWERARIYTQEKGSYEFLPQFAVVPFTLG